MRWRRLPYTANIADSTLQNIVAVEIVVSVDYGPSASGIFCRKDEQIIASKGMLNFAPES